MEELNKLLFIKSTIKQFTNYKLLGEKAIEQIAPEQLSLQLNESTNSIAVIIRHMSGNMISRWTDFKTTDGEKAWRNRDQEFIEESINKEELIEIWEKGWACLFNALNSLESTNLDEIIYIRNEGLTIADAINRQLAHYSYHVGQIVFIAKFLKAETWQSLSTPKNQSADFNNQKFEKEKSRVHFTDNTKNE